MYDKENKKFIRGENKYLKKNNEPYLLVLLDRMLQGKYYHVIAKDNFADSHKKRGVQM